MHKWVYNAKNFAANLPFFIKWAWKWRSWDSSYAINLFSDALELVAKEMYKDKCHVNSMKYARRCSYAAKKLRSAYNDSDSVDVSYRYYAERNPVVFVKLPSGHSRMTHKWAISEEYGNKMFRTITKRTDDWNKARKQEAWQYIHKHISTWWG